MYLPRESRIPYTDRNIKIYIEGMDQVIKLDLEKHKSLLERSKMELLSYREAVSHEVKKKKHYNKLIGGGKFNDEALRESIIDINTNIRHMSDKIKLTQDAIKHHTLIVDMLTQQLDGHQEGMRELARIRSDKKNCL